MAVPKYHEFMKPLLERLADGREHKLRDLYADLADFFRLSAEDSLVETIIVAFAFTCIFVVIVFWVVRLISHLRSSSRHHKSIATKLENRAAVVHHEQCTHCGTEIIPPAMYCKMCGTPIESSIDISSESKRTILTSVNQFSKTNLNQSDSPKTQNTSTIYSCYIKHNREYYMRKFSSSGLSMNFAAFAVPWFWFFYRKMVIIGLIFEVALLIVYFISMLFPIYGIVGGFVLCIVGGLLGNILYRRHIDTQVRRLHESGQTNIGTIMEKRDDTSYLLPIGMGLIYLVLGSLMRWLVLSILS